MKSESQAAARPLPRAGCAPLLALPAALCITTPALAQSVINTSQTGTINLDNESGPVEIATGGSISASGLAVISANLAGQLANAGQLADAAGVGVLLGGGGAGEWRRRGGEQ